MKKWSISLLLVSVLAIAAFAAPAASSAASGPYCPGPGEPYKQCEPPPKEEPPAKTCAAGQVGTYPNCVTPALEITKVKVTKQHATLTALINAPGKLAVFGKGIKTKEVTTAAAGSYNLAVALTNKSKKTLKKKGKFKVSVTVSYAPTGAGPLQKTVKLVFKQKPKKNHHQK